MSKTQTLPHDPPDDEIDGLRLHTLAGAYWAAHQIVQLLGVRQVNTVDQLNRHWRRLPRPTQIRVLRALQDLLEHTDQLAVTTLIRPVDHPLVTRHLIPHE